MKKNKKRDFSKEEHQLLGACLGAASEGARALYTRSCNYSGKTSRISKRARNTFLTIDNLRAALDVRGDYYSPIHRVLFGEEEPRQIPPEIDLFRIFLAVASAIGKNLNTKATAAAPEDGFDGYHHQFEQLQSDLFDLVEKLLTTLNDHADGIYPRNADKVKKRPRQPRARNFRGLLGQHNV